MFSLCSAVRAIVTMSRNCLWGKPCDCRECKDDLKEKCEVCSINKGVSVESFLTKDRKGFVYYDFTTYCQSCRDKYVKPQQQQELFETCKKLFLELNKVSSGRIFFEDGSSVPYGYSKKE